MSTGIKSSLKRLWFGVGFALLAMLVAIFLLPDASGRAAKERRSALDAQANLERQLANLSEYQQMLDQINAGRERIADLETHMPKGDVGDLHISLRNTVFKLANESGVKVPNVKFGVPNREGSRNTGIEAIDVEFTAIGVYQNLKAFMFALEGSGQPFGASVVKLDESPEGGRLSVTLRAFRQASGSETAYYEGAT
jgi:hypothetical protein